MSSEEKRLEVVRVANVSARDRHDAVFFEVHEVFIIEGVEKRHRNADLAFGTREEAEAWVKKQGGQ